MTTTFANFANYAYTGTSIQAQSLASIKNVYVECIVDSSASRHVTGVCSEFHHIHHIGMLIMGLSKLLMGLLNPLEGLAPSNAFPQSPSHLSYMFSHFPLIFFQLALSLIN